MDSGNRLQEVANLRFAFQSKSRMRLEFLGELSKLLRIHGHSVSDDVLATLVVAVPEELPGEGFASSYNRQVRAEERPPTGGTPPARPPEAPPPAMHENAVQFAPPERPPTAEKAAKKKGSKTKPAPKKYLDAANIQSNQEVTDATQHVI
jgi:hypothetical protein